MRKIKIEDIDRFIRDLTDYRRKEQVGELLAGVLHEDLPAARAVQYVDRVLKTFRRISLTGAEDAYTLKALQGIAESYESLSCFEQAACVYQEALEMAGRLNESPSRAALLWRLGRVQRKRNRWEEALACIREGRQLYEDLRDEIGIARSRISEGIIAYEKGDYAAAAEAYQQALEAGERADDRRIVADANNNLGILATIHGDFDRATLHYRSSLALYEQLGKTGSIAQIHHNLGMCYTARQSWSEALDAFEKSLEIAQQQGNMWQTGMTLVHKAAVYLKLSDPTITATYCARAIDIFQEIDYPLGTAEAYKVLGQLFTRKRDWATAGGLLEESLRLCGDYDNPLGAAEVHRELGVLCASKNETEAARRSFEAALERFEQLGAQHEVEVTQELLDAL